MSNTTCDVCKGLTDSAVGTKDGNTVCYMCLTKHYRNGERKSPGISSIVRRTFPEVAKVEKEPAPLPPPPSKSVAAPYIAPKTVAAPAPSVAAPTPKTESKPVTKGSFFGKKKR